MLRKIFLRVIQKPPRWFTVLLVVIYVVFILWPFYTIYFVFKLPRDTRADPEIANGLLTASSIVFSFMLVLTPWHEKWFGGWLVWLVLIPFLILIVAASEMFLWGIGQAYPIDVLSTLMASFQANLVSATILLALRETARKML